MNTPDLNKERLECLKKQMPDLFTDEGRLNEDELRKLVDGNQRESERFDFRWFGKTQSKRRAFTPTNKTLFYDQQRSVNPDLADGNLIIEGENLESLKVLVAAYRNRVACIYIDPPYNTGKDFIYKDNFKMNESDYKQGVGDKNKEGLRFTSNPDTSGRFHSDWLNMIYSRLLLARQLLRDDGVIFISIDDNELCNLEKVCNEVFGSNNKLGSLTVINNWKGRSDDKFFATCNEFLLIYAKNKERSSIGGLEFSEEELAQYSENDNISNYRLVDLRKTGRGWKRESRPNMFYPILIKNQALSMPKKEEIDKLYNKDSGVFNDEYLQLLRQKYEELGYIFVIPVDSDGDMGRWRWGVKTTKSNLLNLEYRETPQKKIFEKLRPLVGDIAKTKKVKTVFYKPQYDTGGSGKRLDRLFGVKEGFNNPKSEFFMRDVLKIGINKDDYCLDFFAGSGTTGEAIMQLNAEDDGNRKFILVQADESVDKNLEIYKQGYQYISDICIERNKRALNKIQKSNPSFKTGFQVYKLTNSQFARRDFAPDPSKSDQDNLDLLEKYIREYEQQTQTALSVDHSNLLDEILLKQGFMLNYRQERLEMFRANTILKIQDQFKECLICLDKNIEPSTTQLLEENFKDLNFICLDTSLDTNLKWDLDRIFKSRLVVF